MIESSIRGQLKRITQFKKKLTFKLTKPLISMLKTKIRDEKG